MIGAMADILEYLDFGWYDWVWYKEDTGLGETKTGKFLGSSHRVGSLMSYWILPSSGIPVSRTTMQIIMYLETCTDANKSRFKVFDDAIQEQCHENYDEAMFSGKSSSNPTMDIWAELSENNKDFKEEFNKVFDNPDVKDSDDGFADNLYKQYVNMELALDQGGDRLEFVKVRKILKDENGRPIGVSNDNPIVESWMYEVEYNNGHTASLAANLIAKNLFAQVDQSGKRLTILDSIKGTKKWHTINTAR